MSQLDAHYEQMRDDLEFLKNPKAEISEIANFFVGKTLFITGATGFMGTIFVEKLLRSCPDIKKIYVLMRQKKDKTIDELLNVYFQSVVFDRLRKINPDFTNKVTGVTGNLEQEHLGLSESDRTILKNEVDIIFHNAANVKFMVRVSLALRANVLGTKHMLELAQECKKLELFVYVSTAYSHCYRKDIYEEFYPSPANLDEVNEIIRKDCATEDGLSEETIELLTGKFPNIYTYTKAISEGLVNQQAKTASYKCVVFRPSIVLPVYKEPTPGWCGNHNGPVLVFLGDGLGIIHAAPYSNQPFDLIPCDLTINGLIAISWDACTRRKNKQPIVYNYGSSTVNPIGCYDFHTSLYERYGHTDLSNKTIWKPFIILTGNKPFFWLLHIIFHFIPACILDLVLMVRGHKPRAVNLFLYATKHLDKIRYFGNGNWRIHVNRTVKVIDRMNKKDKELFYCDLRPEAYDWTDYMIIMWRGLKMYILKEPHNPEVSYRTYVKVSILHYGFLTIVILLTLYWLSRFFL